MTKVWGRALEGRDYCDSGICTLSVLSCKTCYFTLLLNQENRESSFTSDFVYLMDSNISNSYNFLSGSRGQHSQSRVFWGILMSFKRFRGKFTGLLEMWYVCMHACKRVCVCVCVCVCVWERERERERDRWKGGEERERNNKKERKYKKKIKTKAIAIIPEKLVRGKWKEMNFELKKDI